MIKMARRGTNTSRACEKFPAGPFFICGIPYDVFHVTYLNMTHNRGSDEKQPGNFSQALLVLVPRLLFIRSLF